MWPLHLLSSAGYRNERRSSPAGRPCRPSIRLGLETLEERCLLDGGALAATSPLPPPSSPFAATYTLFWDGFQLIDYQHTGQTGIGATVYSPAGIYTIPAGLSIDEVNYSIAFYSPYAGPFALPFLQAGELWEYLNLLSGLKEAESF